MCQERAISTVTSIAVGTYGVHFGGIMHILSTGRYSLRTEMAINAQSEYWHHVAGLGPEHNP